MPGVENVVVENYMQKHKKVLARRSISMVQIEGKSTKNQKRFKIKGKNIMKTIKFLDRRVGSSLAAVGILLGMVAPAALPAFASADQLTSRSLQLSSSAAGATAVTYDLKFTAPKAVNNSGGVVIEFCDDSPLVGLACNHPADMDTSSVTLTDALVGAVTPATLGANKGTAAAVASNYGIKWTAGSSSSGYSAGDKVELIFDGIVNPSTANSNLYARITTYTAANLSGYTDADTLGTYEDDGAVATSITSAIGISAAVKETMTFCVSKAAPAAGCTSTDAPTLTLGEGTPQALNSTTVSTGDIYSQLSTNAANGAVVKMKNSTGCGGLKRVGAAGCDIAPIGDTGIVNTSLINQSGGKFGMAVGTPAGVTGSFGTITPDAVYSAAGLGANTYAMDDTAVTGVSGTYGDAIYSSSAPVANTNVPMTFAAVAGLTTPAGSYKADINLIATGTY